MTHQFNPAEGMAGFAASAPHDKRLAFHAKYQDISVTTEAVDASRNAAHDCLETNQTVSNYFKGRQHEKSALKAQIDRIQASSQNEPNGSSKHTEWASRVNKLENFDGLMHRWHQLPNILRSKAPEHNTMQAIIDSALEAAATECDIELPDRVQRLARYQAQREHGKYVTSL